MSNAQKINTVGSGDRVIPGEVQVLFCQDGCRATARYGLGLRGKVDPGRMERRISLLRSGKKSTSGRRFAETSPARPQHPI
jgi:hypothetical protein